MTHHESSAVYCDGPGCKSLVNAWSVRMATTHVERLAAARKAARAQGWTCADGPADSGGDFCPACKAGAAVDRAAELRRLIDEQRRLIASPRTNRYDLRLAVARAAQFRAELAKLEAADTVPPPAGAA